MMFVLLHGGWQGGWCWDGVVSRLKSLGHGVYAPTLRGLEEGMVNRSGVTLQDSAEGVAEFVLEHDLNDFVLVGHSGSGPVIQLLADQMPERIQRLMFVDAWVLRDGESVYDILLEEANLEPLPALADGTIVLDLEVWKNRYMQDGTPEQFAVVLPRLVPCPVGWLNHPIHLTRFYQLHIPSSYIFLRQDLSVPREIYQHMAHRLTNPKIVECDGSHEAMLTKPAELTEALLVASS